MSCIFNDRPDRLLPVQFQPKHHKPPSIHEEGRPQFGREEGDFVCHFGARSPRPKTPRKTPTEGADTSMGVDDPEILQQEKGEEGIRKRQRAQTPRQSMGPSPSPDLPRKTRRQESPVPQEEWPPLRRGGDSTSPDSGTVPNTEKSPNLERTEQESRTTGETPRDPEVLTPPRPEEVHHSCRGAGPLSLMLETCWDELPFQWPSNVMRPYRAILISSPAHPELSIARVYGGHFKQKGHLGQSKRRQNGTRPPFPSHEPGHVANGGICL